MLQKQTIPKFQWLRTWKIYLLLTPLVQPEEWKPCFTQLSFRTQGNRGFFILWFCHHKAPLFVAKEVRRQRSIRQQLIASKWSSLEVTSFSHTIGRRRSQYHTWFQGWQEETIFHIRGEKHPKYFRILEIFMLHSNRVQRQNNHFRSWRVF